jgi:glycosyltransferase involved in cell wall biosynthesis
MSLPTNQISPRVSIVMPAYNAAVYIKEAIASVLAQGFSDFELLVVNDCSTDDTAAIVRELAVADKRIELLEHEQNQGVAGAINTGLRAARGEYIARADADDLNRPDRLRKQVAYLDAHPEIILVGAGYAPFGNPAAPRRVRHPADSLTIAWRFLGNTVFCHPTVMMRRAVVDAVGLYPDVQSEDYAFFSRVVRRYRTANLPDILLDYRDQPANRSNSAAGPISESVRVQAQANYEHYFGNSDHFDLYFRYIHFGRLSLRDWSLVKRLNRIVLDKAATTYQLAADSSAMRRARWAMWRFSMFSLLRQFYKPL